MIVSVTKLKVLKLIRQIEDEDGQTPTQRKLAEILDVNVMTINRMVQELKADGHDLTPKRKHNSEYRKGDLRRALDRCPR